LQAKHVVYRQILLEFFSRCDFVAYSAQYYRGSDKGIYCEFLVPDGWGEYFASFLESLSSHGIIDAYTIRPVITFKNIVMGFEWYDFSTNTWYFNWQTMLKDLLLKIDSHTSPHGYELELLKSKVKFDFYDLCILHHLEQDVFTPLAPLASKLGTSPQNLSYHFRNHVLKNGLIRFTRPYWYPFLFEESSPYILDLEFENNKALNCFLESLHRKPIAYSRISYEQVTHPSVMLMGFLPYYELFNFTNLLDLLKDYGMVKDYNYYIIDVHRSNVKSLPCHCYDESTGWRFDLEPCLRGILKTAKKAQEGKVNYVAKFASATDNKIESI